MIEEKQESDFKESIRKIEEKYKMRKKFKEIMEAGVEKVDKQLGAEEDLCPHGISLSRTCKQCDTVTPDQIQDSIKLA